MNLKSLGELVRTRRTELGLSQAQLGHLCHLSRTTINLLENGTLSDLGVVKTMQLMDTLGLQLQRTTALPDHHTFTPTTLCAPQADIVIITSKDAVKCDALPDDKIWVAQVHSTFSDLQFTQWLNDRLKQIQTALH